MLLLVEQTRAEYLAQILRWYCAWDRGARYHAMKSVSRTGRQGQCLCPSHWAGRCRRGGEVLDPPRRDQASLMGRARQFVLQRVRQCDRSQPGADMLG